MLTITDVTVVPIRSKSPNSIRTDSDVMPPLPVSVCHRSQALTSRDLMLTGFRLLDDFPRTRVQVCPSSLPPHCPWGRAILTLSRSHTSCITEAEKYQGALYKGAKKVCPVPLLYATLDAHEHSLIGIAGQRLRSTRRARTGTSSRTRTGTRRTGDPPIPPTSD